MKIIYPLLLICFLSIGHSYNLRGQSSELIQRTFANPSVPGTLVLQGYEGDVLIEGYEGWDVIIEAKVKSPSLYSNIFQLGREKPFSVSEMHNTILIKVDEQAKSAVNFNIKVPTKTTLKIYLSQGGEVKARYTSRLVEVNNQNGAIVLEDLMGWAVVNTAQGDIEASFTEVIHNKTMSFITLSGDVILDFPKDLEADFRMKSTSGQVFNEFAEILAKPEATIRFEDNLGPSVDQKMGFRSVEPENPYEPKNQAQDILQNKSGSMQDSTKRAFSQDTYLFDEQKEEIKKEQEFAPAISQATGRTQNNRQSTYQNQADKKQKSEDPGTKGQTYVAASSYKSNANQGGPVFFIYTRSGAIKVNKYRKRK